MFGQKTKEKPAPPPPVAPALLTLIADVLEKDDRLTVSVESPPGDVIVQLNDGEQTQQLVLRALHVKPI